MSVEVSEAKKPHRKMRRYVLWSIVTIAAAAIVSLELYLVLPNLLFPFATLPVFAVLVFLLTLLVEDDYYGRNEIDQEVSADNANG